jgi:hypothetical protein
MPPAIITRKNAWHNNGRNKVRQLRKIWLKANIRPPGTAVIKDDNIITVTRERKGIRTASTRKGQNFAIM